MAEYIEREAVERKLADIYMGLGGYKTRDAFYKAIDLVHRYPAADVAPVRPGRWEDEYGGKYENPRYRCSVCKEKALYKFERDVLGKEQAVQALSLSCPSCCAVMDLEDHDGK